VDDSPLLGLTLAHGAAPAAAAARGHELLSSKVTCVPTLPPEPHPTSSTVPLL
jgi:hypothetical protein